MIRALAWAAFAPATVASVCASAQQHDEWTVRARSLAPFLTPAPAAVPMRTALPGGGSNPVPRPDVAAAPGWPAWLRPLLEHRHRDAIDAGRLELTVARAGDREAGDGRAPRAGDTLLLRGRATDVAACERDLDALAAVVGRPIEVSAWRLPLADGALPPATWAPGRLQQELQRTPAAWTARGRTRPGGSLRLAAERGIAHLRDLDTEVAEGAKIFDPKVSVAFAGIAAVVTVDVLPGDELVLQGSWLLSEPVQVHDQDVGDRSASVDLPEHRTAWVTFGGRIASGGALVVAGRGAPVGPDGFVLVLGARFVAPPAGEAVPGVLLRPVGALLATTTVARPQLGWARLGDDSPLFAEVDNDGGLSPHDLGQLLRVQPPAEYEIDGRMLIVRGDASPSATAAADAVLRELASSLQTVVLHTSVTGEDGAVLELAQPALADRVAAAFVGRERAVVRDQEVEIAAKVAASNPVVDVAHSGLWLDARAARTGAGWHVAGRWTVAVHDEPRDREHADRTRMTMQLVDYRTTTLPWDGVMATDQAHELGDGPALARDGAATRVAVRLLMQ